MRPLEAFLHVCNFFAPALALGLLAAALSKLFWRRALAGVRWQRLAAWGSAAATLALMAGLLLTGRDGAMATYAAMVAGCAAALWWAGFSGRR